MASEATKKVISKTKSPVFSSHTPSYTPSISEVEIDNNQTDVTDNNLNLSIGDRIGNIVSHPKFKWFCMLVILLVCLFLYLKFQHNEDKKENLINKTANNGDLTPEEIDKAIENLQLIKKDLVKNNVTTQDNSNMMQQNMNNNMAPNMQQNMPPNMPPNMAPNMPPNMHPNMHPNMPPNMPPNMHPNMPPNMQRNVPQNIQPNMPQNMPNNMPPNSPSDMNSNDNLSEDFENVQNNEANNTDTDESMILDRIETLNDSDSDSELNMEDDNIKRHNLTKEEINTINKQLEGLE